VTQPNFKLGSGYSHANLGFRMTDYAISDIVDNRFIEYLSVLILPRKPFT
jgi:hypothetical protein